MDKLIITEGIISLKHFKKACVSSIVSVTVLSTELGPYALPERHLSHLADHTHPKETNMPSISSKLLYAIGTGVSDSVTDVFKNFRAV